MSPLTKTFVLLHVVLSMLLTAGLIVFINRVADYKTLNTTALADVNTARRERDAARAEAQATKAAADSAVLAANNAASDARAASDKLNQDILALRGDLAKRDATLASAQAALQGAQTAMGAAQSNQGVLQAQLIETRKSGDENQRKLTDANLAISDLSNRNQVLERQLRNAMEEIAAMKEEGSAGQAASTDAGGTPAAGGSTQANINGVIRATQTIGGIKYATISVGSADAVRKGMEFRVVGGQNGNQFLGYVTVTNVEPHEAVGRLSGPRVGEVAPENEVRTRL